MTATAAVKPAVVGGDSWFTVDKAGLAQLLTRKHGKLHAIIELVSNAWDQNVSVVRVAIIRAIESPGSYRLIVEDDDPEGFADLTHAYTVFAPSTKKGDVLKRGRFNLGEKLVLALCDEASISTTKGTVRFTLDGKREVSGDNRQQGSEFSGLIRMTEIEATEAISGLQTLLPPGGIETFVNGSLMQPRFPEMSFEALLDSEVAGEDGNLRRTHRTGQVELYLPYAGEKPTIYEMGIPVVGSTGYFHVNVGQKVPLNMDRDNVTPSYARSLHVHVMNAAYAILPMDEFTSSWAKAALGDDRILPDAVTASVKARYGDKVVAFDPSDPEANRLAVAQGYTLIHGGTLSKGEWSRVKDAGAILPAGKVTPSPKVEFEQGGGESAYLSVGDWTPGMAKMAKHSQEFAVYAGLGRIAVNFVNKFGASYLAACGPLGLIYNIGTLGKAFFEEIGERQDALLLHELGHIRVNGAEGGHLDAHYPDEIARLGARLARYYLLSSGHPLIAEVQ